MYMKWKLSWYCIKCYFTKIAISLSISFDLKLDEGWRGDVKDALVVILLIIYVVMSMVFYDLSFLIDIVFICYKYLDNYKIITVLVTLL